MTGTNHGHTPGLAYQAVNSITGHKAYSAELAKGIRHIEDYKPEELESKGVTKGGKVTAEGLMVYINEHIAKPLLGKRKFDSNDAGYLANFLAIKRLVERYGSKGVTSDLLERVAATYMNTSAQYISQKDIAYAGTLSTSDGKEGVKKIAEITGQNIILGSAINALKDPSDVQNLKGEMEKRLTEIVEEAVATDKIDKILEEVQHAEAHAHGSH